MNDKDSHDLQNRIDVIMDMLKPPKIITKSLICIVLDMLENVRDDIPCCGDENQ